MEILIRTPRKVRKDCFDRVPYLNCFISALKNVYMNLLLIKSYSWSLINAYLNISQSICWDLNHEYSVKCAKPQPQKVDTFSLRT